MRNMLCLLVAIGCSVTFALSPAKAEQFSCTEQGVLDAIATGGGPHTFNCPGPTTVTTSALIVVDNDVILDGDGYLALTGGDYSRVLQVEPFVETELRDFTITGGGGIRNEGTLKLMNATVSNNQARVGGGIFNKGLLIVTNSSIVGNSASPNGGGIFNSFGTSLVTNSVISGNTATLGGGIYNSRGTVVLTHSVISGNTAHSAGGIRNQSGSVTITNCTIEANTASFQGGGLESQDPATGSAATATIVNSTFVGNRASPSYPGRGGAIFNGVESWLTLTNSTISDNSADRGSGIFAGESVTLTQCTVSGNLSGNGYDIENWSGTLVLANSLVDGDCRVAGVSSGGNLESPADTCGLAHATDLANVSAAELALGPLADNGGPTETHALEPSSPAVDVVGLTCESRDQRGVARPQDGNGDGIALCDIGAFELELPLLWVDVDIRPPSLAPVDLSSLPVAILGSGLFNVMDIDVATLHFGPGEAACIHDLTDNFIYNEHLQDVNLDGYVDLMTHFLVQETGITCEDETATLAGSLMTDGTLFEGLDSVFLGECRRRRSPNRGGVVHERRRAPAEPIREQRVD